MENFCNINGGLGLWAIFHILADLGFGRNGCVLTSLPKFRCTWKCVLMDADQLAEACAEAMWKNDKASQTLGMSIDKISSGGAVLSMKVRADMLNGQRICHGGYMFLLADSAFAFACNGYNQFTVAQSCKIDFLAPAFEGEVLQAVAKERYREGRSGIYDCTITNQDGKTIAEMRGNSRTVKGRHLPDIEENVS